MLTLKIVKPDDAMDWMTFVSSLVGSVAWPVAAFAIAFLFRAQIRKLLDRLRKLSVGENSVDFTEQLDGAEVVAEQAVEDVPAAAPAELPFDERTLQLLRISPSALVLDRFRAIERKVNDMAAPYQAESLTGTRRQHPSFRESARLLQKEGKITGATASLLGELYALRTAAAHARELTTADAVRFLQIVSEADRALSHLA